MTLVTAHGAACNGTTDDTAAIQRAINAAAASTGDGVVEFPWGKTCRTTNTLYIGNGSYLRESPQRGVILRGEGPHIHMGGLGFAEPNVSISYQGPNGKAIIRVLGPLQGWGVQNLSIDGNNRLGSFGILNTSGSFGQNRSIYIRNCKYGVYTNVVSKAPPGIIASDALHNRWENICIHMNKDAGDPVVFGIVETGNTTGGGNTAFGDWNNVYLQWENSAASGKTANALYVQAADSNVYNNFHITGFPGSSCNSVVLGYTVNPDWPGSNTFSHFDIGLMGPPVNAGTPSGTDSKPNWWRNPSLTNRSNYPVLANLLTDHMSGTWTPTLTGTGGGTAFYLTRVGSFEMNGYNVTARFRIVTSGTTGMSGDMLITGLPIASTDELNEDGGCVITGMSGVTLSGGYQTLTGVVTNSDTRVFLLENGTGSLYRNASVTKFNGAGNMELRGFVTYKREGHR